MRLTQPPPMNTSHSDHHEGPSKSSPEEHEDHSSSSSSESHRKRAAASVRSAKQQPINSSSSNSSCSQPPAKKSASTTHPSLDNPETLGSVPAAGSDGAAVDAASAVLPSPTPRRPAADLGLPRGDGAPQIPDFLARLAQDEPSRFSALLAQMDRNARLTAPAGGNALEEMLLNSLAQQQQQLLLPGGFTNNSWIHSSRDESKLDAVVGGTSLYSSIANARLSALSGQYQLLEHLNPPLSGASTFATGANLLMNNNTATNEILLQEMLNQARTDNMNLLRAAMNNQYSTASSIHPVLPNVRLPPTMLGGSDPMASLLAAQNAQNLAFLNSQQVMRTSGDYHHLTNSLLQQQLLIQQQQQQQQLSDAQASNFAMSSGANLLAASSNRPEDTFAARLSMAQMVPQANAAPSVEFAAVPPTELNRVASGASQEENTSSTDRTMSEDVNTTVPAVVNMHSPDDTDHLSAYQCLLRGQIQFFTATAQDASISVQGRKKRVRIGQVGIQCRHCAHLPHRLRNRGAIYYPTHLSGVYQVVQNMSILHLIQSCQEIPNEIREELRRVRGSRLDTVAGSGRKYWIIKFAELGLVEHGNGLFFRKT